MIKIKNFIFVSYNVFCMGVGKVIWKIFLKIIFSICVLFKVGMGSKFKIFKLMDKNVLNNKSMFKLLVWFNVFIMFIILFNFLIEEFFIIKCFKEFMIKIMSFLNWFKVFLNVWNKE